MSGHIADADQRYTSRRGLIELWTGMVLAPLAWTLHLNVSYILAGMTCDSSANLVMIGGSVAFFAMAAVGLWYAWGSYRKTGSEWPSGDQDGVLIRSRFIAISGIALSGLSMLLIIAQTIPMLVLPPCR